MLIRNRILPLTSQLALFFVSLNLHGQKTDQSTQTTLLFRMLFAR